MLTAIAAATIMNLQPCTMHRVTFVKDETAPVDRLIPIEVAGKKGDLFIPEGYSPDATGLLRISVHSPNWYALSEHLKANLHEPLLILALGEGSATYAAPFKLTSALPDWLRAVEAKIPGYKVRGIRIASFSAGYGAVREWMKQPGNRMLIRRVLLCDSFYGGYLDAKTRLPDPANIDPWLPYARDAMAGRVSFVATNSRITPNSYLSTWEVARAVGAKLGQSFVVPTSGAATSDPNYPLLEQLDAGHLHFWNYGGQDAQAHTVHLRHMAEIWRAMDDAKMP